MTECDFHAFGRTVNIRRVKHGAAESRQKNIKNGNRSAKIAAVEFGFHLLGHEIVRDQ